MENIPDEVVLLIGTKLNCCDILRFSEVSKRYHNVLNDDFVWKNLFKKDFPKIMFMITGSEQYAAFRNSPWKQVYQYCYTKQLQRFRGSTDNLGVKYHVYKISDLFSALLL